ncbi:MAG: FAD/NAD(P)-binding protein [Desulfatiglandales bacterium]
MESLDYKTARLVDIVPETRDVKTYSFFLEEEAQFLFSPGQFNMIGLPGVEEAPISVSSSAESNKNVFSHTIRRAGNVTSLTALLGIGDRIMVRGPFGRPWPVEKLGGRDVLLVAGGIGLAPLRPLILHCLAERNKMNDLVLVYGAKSPDNMVFQKDLIFWQEQEEIRTLYCADKVQEGRLSPLKIREGLVPQFLEGLGLNRTAAVVCLCGPEIMMRFVARKLLQEGYLGDHIFVSMERRMRCGTAHCGHCQIGSKFVCRDGPVFSYVDIKRFEDALL